MNSHMLFDENAITLKDFESNQHLKLNFSDSDVFFSNNSGLSSGVLSFNSEMLIFSNEKNKSQNFSLKLRDLVGSSYGENVSIKAKSLYEIQIFSFEIINSFYRKTSKKREFITRKLFHNDLDIIRKWNEKFLILSKYLLPTDSFIIENKAPIPLEIFVKRKLLVFVNRLSGKGKGLSIFNQFHPILEREGYEFEVIITAYSQHASEVVSKKTEIEMLQYYAIVAVSGDGLIHEIINGIFNRNDWKTVKEIPLFLIPAGSGNAFSKNICKFSKEAYNLENIMYILGKGQKKAIDIVRYEIDDKKVYSFLAFVWALIADIDLESERLRFCGGSRFIMWAVVRLLWMRRYRGRLSYCINESNQDWITIDDEFVHFIVGKMPLLTETDNFLPLCDIQDGFMDLQMVRGNNISKFRMIKLMLKLDEEGSIINMPEKKVWENSGLEYIKVKSFKFEPYGANLGVYAIDGERYEAKKIQGFIMEKALNIIAL